MQVWDFIQNILPKLSVAISDFLATLLPGWVVYIIMALLSSVMLLLFLVPTMLVVMYLERKVIGHFQVRRGPMRTGPHGTLQPVADAVKIMMKEDIRPAKADRWPFYLAPVVCFAPPILALAVLPFAPGAIFADLNIGILFIISITTLGLMGMLMAGWGSANKYALLGAMRAVAQMVSYEIPLVLSVIGVVMIVGSLSLSDIVAAQKIPFIILQPIGFFIFVCASLAELNRTPFDIVEAESEIIAGYHTEYSGIKFGAFYLAEYTNAIISSAIIATVFLGGWKGPILPPYLWLVLKILVVFCGIVWIRGTLPRLRVDQLMNFAWKGLLPLALLNIIIAAAEAWIFGGWLSA